MVRLLFVCMGNICRSPMVEGAFQARIDAAGLGDVLSCDSAGTIGYHVGSPPDRRAQAAARARGIDLSPLRARRVASSDYQNFDHILAMDHSNFGDLQAMASDGDRATLSMFLDYAPHLNVAEVPDPYYGGDEGFEHVLDLIEAAADGLMADLVVRHNLPEKA